MIRNFTFFIVCCFFHQFVFSQVISVNNLINATTLPVGKADNFLVQKGFIRTGVEYQADSMVRTYWFKGRKRNNKDTTSRWLTRSNNSNTTILTFYTASYDECLVIQRDLVKDGFKNVRLLDSVGQTPVMFQKNDIAIKLKKEQTTHGPGYAFCVQKRMLPGEREVEFANDLLRFNSHENLEYVFGRSNVKRDVYYFSEREFSRCSVLYPNTERQVVFIWKDEQNDYDLLYILVGGNLTAKELMNYNRHVAENNWKARSNVHAGMSLAELRKLNGADFSFYSASSPYSGMILPNQSGSIDFKKESIVLACLNCSDMKTSSRQTLSADTAMAEDRRFFVFTIMLYPGLESKN